MAFIHSQKADPFLVFPIADYVTSRLKKLVALISRTESSEGKYDFLTPLKANEVSGLSVDEKTAIVDILVDSGIPLKDKDPSKNDWGILKNKVVKMLPNCSDLSEKTIEKFTSAIQVES